MKEDYIEMLEDYLKLELGDEQVLGLNSFAVNNILNIIKNLDKEIDRLKNDIKRITEITNQKIKIINDVREYIKSIDNYFLSDSCMKILEILEGDKQ